MAFGLTSFGLTSFGLTSFGLTSFSFNQDGSVAIILKNNQDFIIYIFIIQKFIIWVCNIGLRFPSKISLKSN